LANLVFQKQISVDTAMIRSSMPDELTEMLSRGGALQKGVTPVKK
jgi:hypothetical protein